jgi:hypothetical protein
MSCKSCESARQESVSGELTLTFSTFQSVNVTPVYICQKILVCLACGYTEIVVPTPQLQQIRKGVEVSHSKGET